MINRLFSANAGAKRIATFASPPASKFADVYRLGTKEVLSSENLGYGCGYDRFGPRVALTDEEKDVCVCVCVCMEYSLLLWVCNSR